MRYEFTGWTLETEVDLQESSQTFELEVGSLSLKSNFGVSGQLLIVSAWLDSREKLKAGWLVDVWLLEVNLDNKQLDPNHSSFGEGHESPEEAVRSSAAIDAAVAAG